MRKRCVGVKRLYFGKTGHACMKRLYFGKTGHACIADGRGMWHEWATRNAYGVSVQNLNVRDHLEDPDINGSTLYSETLSPLATTAGVQLL
jgi:hypothetical protein